MAVVGRAGVLDDKGLAERREQLAVMHQEHNAVLQQFGDGQPYVRDHYVTDCKYYAHRARESVILLGRRLIVMKAFEPHGEWLPLLDQISVDSRFAQKAMLAASRFAGLPEPAARNLRSAAGN